jgi:hypothetical protein
LSCAAPVTLSSERVPHDRRKGHNPLVPAFPGDLDQIVIGIDIGPGQTGDLATA